MENFDSKVLMFLFLMIFFLFSSLLYCKDTVFNTRTYKI